MKRQVKNILTGIGVIALFLLLSYGFMPELLKGKIVNQADISGFIGMSRETTLWNSEHPEAPALWTDSMFGGMPTTAIVNKTPGDYTQPIYNILLAGKRPATYLFVTLLGAFLMFLAFGVSVPVAIGGAIAVAFCSYNFQIIQVGHNTKMQAIAFMPWVLAALVYTYKRGMAGKGKLAVLGAVLFALALSMQIKANHQQITYYLAIMVLLYAAVEFALAIRKKKLKEFFLSSLLLLFVGIAGIATNANKLLPLQAYTPNTMRGGSELVEEESSTGGLDLDYATAWSYGWEELPNLMIPNFNGGASAQAVNPDRSETVKLLKRAGQRNVRETAKALPMYWGPQPFTAGPMYMGAITAFLFILGLCLAQRKEKWWIGLCCAIAILMAVGNHFMPFTELCFKYLPLYNKFRTVSMALVVLQVALPLLGFITLDRILKQDIDKKRFTKALWISTAVTAGFCLVCFLAPSLFGDFRAPSDTSMQSSLAAALAQDRISLFKADSLRSLLFIGTAALLLWWGSLKNGKRGIAVAAVCVLVLVDLFSAGKRYLNASHFVTPKDFTSVFAERTADKIILEDTDPQYRVLDLSVNVFNSSVPSYHHKSVGGYSPAKLQRYQDLIDHYLTGEINGLYGALQSASDVEDIDKYMEESAPLLNALNTRYIILSGDYPPLENLSAYGPAWFVGDAVYASSPKEEIDLVGKVDLRKTAVLKGAPARSFSAGSATSITLESYTPNTLTYSYSATENALAVFSEVYYPEGWTATVDGESIELMSADWCLRAAVLPAGEHTLTMNFAPNSYKKGAAVSTWASLLLLLLLAGSVLSLKVRK